MAGSLKRYVPVVTYGEVSYPLTQAERVKVRIVLPDTVEAPVEQGQKLGEMVISVGGQEQQTIPIVADRAVARLTLPGIFSRFLKTLFMAE